MPKVKYLRLGLYSRKGIDIVTGKRLLNLLINFENGLMKPQKYGTFEPLRQKFNINNLKDFENWFNNLFGMFIFLKSVKPIRYDLTMEHHYNSNLRINNRLVPRIIKSEVTFWIDIKFTKLKGENTLIKFFKKIFKILDADYGFLTLYEDYDKKNYLITKSSMSYEGQILEENGLPGLYWTNIFGKDYVKWFGKEKFNRIECWKKEFLEDGSLLIQFSEKPEDCLSKSVLKQQKKAIKLLGENTFFDIKKINKKVRIPDFLKVD